MRTTFVNTLKDLAKKDKRIFLLTGDLGFSIFEGYKKEFPHRFLNMGVAEQNMIGAAAGLALSGKIVFVYSIIPFVTMRCFEQIRNDLCMQKLNVKIVGMGAGVHYGTSGATHHAIEDIGIMRSLPNIAILSPSTKEETEYSLREAVNYSGVVYIRLSGIDYSDSSYTHKKFAIGRGVMIKDGFDMTIMSTGGMLDVAQKVVVSFEREGISVRFISMPSLKPFDAKIILESARKTKAIFTIEDHSVIGGLGSIVSEVLAESKYKVLFHRFAFPDEFSTAIGSRDYLSDRCGLSSNQIKKMILEKVKMLKML